MSKKQATVAAQPAKALSVTAQLWTAYDEAAEAYGGREHVTGEVARTVAVALDLNANSAALALPRWRKARAAGVVGVPKGASQHVSSAAA